LIERYKGNVSSVIARPIRWMVVYGMIASVMAFLILRLPTGFLPSEDQGNSMVQFSLPEGASFKRSDAVAREIERYFLNEEGNNTEAIESYHLFIRYAPSTDPTIADAKQRIRELGGTPNL